ncbi:MULTISPECIES: histone deacetylase family protein [Halocynthiibacter]|uniref:Histone deacetylase family protein n=1 Tax=Halocynthiibacter halioticoli TaxID=2986804 RepID=A0AAE3IYB2_9RHOB|nr:MULTISPECIES: histone deacetylase family protein [Halocynthiibacter]MCV6823133.1 histone deacetylase family protein [Halocynthiibacter halioticoli]MCW4056134.1 histone deacetylase family protein [Halocynthiibacter sp. SDUM655004]
MTTALLTHSDCLLHQTPAGHAEQIARLEHVLAALDHPKFDPILRKKAPLVADDDLLRVHPKAHIDDIKDSAPESGIVQLDADTFMSEGSLSAALRAAGANTRAVDLVLSGEAQNAFAAVRPPGHHAERQTPMGFCLFGSVAVGAKYALEVHGLKRVAIIDFDVHHGNGTQDLLEGDPRVFFASSHQMPLYPGTGHAHETGAANNVLNVPLAEGSNGRDLRRVYEEQILPNVALFRPELIFISAGFDAHSADPLAGLNWSTEDFRWLTHRICDLADETCSGRVVSSLEGGYDLNALAECVAAHVEILMERGA